MSPAWCAPLSPRCNGSGPGQPSRSFFTTELIELTGSGSGAVQRNPSSVRRGSEASGDVEEGGDDSAVLSIAEADDLDVTDDPRTDDW